jgi:hypothetical protein
MIQVPNWEDAQVLEKEVKSCDNHDIGDVKETNRFYIVTRKGDRVSRIPRGAVASFDGGKLYLRATESEVLAGMYPFVSESAESELERQFENPKSGIDKEK